MQEDSSSFWNFSLAVYGEIGAQRECLDLQDRYGIDVNLLLFCAFVGAVHAAILSPADLRQAEQAVHEWHVGVVNSLRVARRALKAFSHGPARNGVETLYSRIKDQELEAERLEQAMLERWSALYLHAWSKALPSAAVAKNIATLFDVCLEGADRPEPPHNLIAHALRYPEKSQQSGT